MATAVLAAGAGAAAGASGPFAGAPMTQNNPDGVASGMCRLAPLNHYLPPRSGCVSVRVADVDGDGRPDLILLYSRLSNERAPSFSESPPSWRHMYVASHAFVRVVRASGGVLTARIPDARATAFDSVAQVNDDPGDELFIQVSQISSGSTNVAYSFDAGQLVPSGVLLGSGGDSGARAGFDCLTGARLLQRTFEFDGPTEDAWWTETNATYAWHGPRLVEVNHRSFKRRGLPPRDEIDVGSGCVTGTG